jgi:hypothetical protein
MGTALTLVAFAVIVIGTLALGVWALRRHDRQFPKGRVHLDPGEESSIETKTTWLSGGRS